MNRSDVILVVDDSEIDLELIKAAFQWGKMENPVHSVNSGVKALQYLKGEGEYADRNAYPLPVLMLLDVNMPVVDGFRILEWIKAHPQLRRITVIVFSGSESPEVIAKAYDHGASGFLVKPTNSVDMIAMVRNLRDWLKICHFPALKMATVCTAIHKMVTAAA